jgi:hypothetical protein
VWWTLAAVAAAVEPGEWSVGAELGASLDLPDHASGEHTRFGPGPSLAIPVRVGLTDATRLRLTPFADVAFGHDRVRWTQVIDGAPITFHDDDHFTMLGAAGALVGAEWWLVDGETLDLALGADVGAAFVGTWHSLGGPTQVLLDPEQNDLDDPRNIDPYATAIAAVAGLDLTASVPMADGLRFTVRTGYSSAFVPARPLRKAPAALDPDRAAFGFNPIRLSIGVARAF